MSILAVEIHDAGILAKADPPTAANRFSESPGYAVVDGDTVLTGAEARDIARLKPRRVNNRFWSDLNTAPLPRPFPDGISHADLAHAHLQGVWREVGSDVDDVLLTLPGSHSDHQLGLILSIARACGMPVTGLVDSAVAASAHDHPGSRLLHVDLQLHRTVVTELARGRDVSRRQVKVSAHTGLVSLTDAWAKRVAAIFVRDTRFDPLHVASTEQMLYRRLPDALERLRSESTTTLQIDGPAKTHAVALNRRQMVDAVADAYDGIVHLVRMLTRAGERATILLTHRVSALPELPARLADVTDSGVVVLPAGAAADGALLARGAIRSPGEALPFITRLEPPGGASPIAAAVPDRPAGNDFPRDGGAPPTHVLHDGVAHPIIAEPFALGVALPDGRRGLELTGTTAGISRLHCTLYRSDDRVVVEDHSTHGTYLNGRRIETRAELEVGDGLRLGSPGIVLRLIRVVDDDGTP